MLAERDTKKHINFTMLDPNPPLPPPVKFSIHNIISTPYAQIIIDDEEKWNCPAEKMVWSSICLLTIFAFKGLSMCVKQIIIVSIAEILNMYGYIQDQKIYDTHPARYLVSFPNQRPLLLQCPFFLSLGCLAPEISLLRKLPRELVVHESV